MRRGLMIGEVSDSKMSRVLVLYRDKMSRGLVPLSQLSRGLPILSRMSGSSRGGVVGGSFARRWVLPGLGRPTLVSTGANGLLLCFC